MPGFVNAHTHAAMTLFRGFADDLPLMEWLQGHIWPAEARLQADDVYWGTRLACAEMIRSGTVCFWDMYWQPEATARAVRDAGLRAVTGPALIDNCDPDATESLREASRSGFEDLDRVGAELVEPSFAPHSIYAVSEPSLRWIGEQAAESGHPIQIHFCETEGEVQRCVEQYGIRPAEYLQRCGVLGPKTLLAHSVWLDDGDRELIAASGATTVSCPQANMKLAVGAIFDLPAARAAGVAVALGTDGAGSNNALNMLAEAKQLALLQKHRAGEPAAVTAAETLAIARGQRSPLPWAGTGGAAGPPTVGGPADFLLVRLDSPQLGVGALDAGLAYAADPTVIDTTVIAGRVLLHGGRLVHDDLVELVARARESAQRLGLVQV